MLTTKSLLTSPTQPVPIAFGPPPPDAPPDEPSPDATAPPDEPSPDFDVGSDENPPLAEVEAVEADPPSGPAGAFCGCISARPNSPHPINAQTIHGLVIAF